MSYTPPAGDAIVLNFSGSYIPPTGDAIVLAFGDTAPSASVDLTAVASNTSVGSKVCSSSANVSAIADVITDALTIQEVELWEEVSRITRTFTEQSVISRQYSGTSLIDRILTENSALTTEYSGNSLVIKVFKAISHLRNT
jgi:hypothetical protein